ncbi:hypothetical protein ACVT87_002548 [Yersinia enterocolitica]
MTQKSIKKTDECRGLLSAIVKYVCEYDPTVPEASYRNFNLGIDHVITKLCSPKEVIHILLTGKP